MPLIAPLEPAAFPEAGALLARAFADDPGTRYITSGLAAPQDFERELFALLLLRETAAGAAALAARGGDGGLLGLALYLPPGASGASLLDWLKDWRRLRPLLKEPGACWRAAKLQHAIDALRSKGDSLYLKLLAVDPAAQGLGAGTALLGEIGRRAAEARAAVTLETFKSANVAYYRARGFSLVAEIAPANLPHFWQLRKKA